MRTDRHHRPYGRERNCASTRRSLSAFLDGEVGSALSESICRHLGTCIGCAHRLEELVNVSAASHDLVGNPMRPAWGRAIGAPTDRLAAIVHRLSENRREQLGLVVRSVLAFRILRSVGCGGSVYAGQTALPAEGRLLEQARALVRELAALDPTAERLARVRLGRWLKDGSYEDLRNSGLIDAPPPPLRSADDRQGRARVLGWARRALREFRDHRTDAWREPTPCCD